ncbi:hypothetical protein CY35_08G127200 [Sphagnum magellanicum]|nr:hypothetical protein CY35_08G127200 [Sphagnum magellanicum]
MWIKERLAKLNYNNPQFSLCCENGKLEVLLTSKDGSALKFRDQIRMYNSVLAFTSFGAKVDESVTRGPGPYSFCIQGELYHKIESLCSTERQCPQFAQLHIHDTKCEHQNRHAIMPSLDPMTLDRLLTMMYNINPYVEVFKMAGDMMATEGAPMDLKLRLIASRTKNARRYNVPMAVDRRDVVVAQQAGLLQRISELHVGYMALHYPLLFPYSEDGWHPNIPLNGIIIDVDLDEDHVEEAELQRKHCNVTMVEFYVIEQNRLKYLRLNQKKLRADLYQGLQDAIIILPSSFTLGPCHMLKELINDIHKKHILGRMIARIYVIKFQKRGLPHAHILIFFVENCKPHTVEDVDCMISAELPNLESNRLAHETFQSETVMDVNGYPIYRHKDTGHTLLVHGIKLDNRWVYDAHINVEVCNNIRAVKYLFNDNATEGNVVEADEIKKYLDYRYVSASEVAWHIFKFDMHERFHEVATRLAISKTMLTEWFKTNQESEQWVWNRKLKRWTMPKRGFAIGRMYYAHPTLGATSYEHLRTMDGTEHDTLKDACIAMALEEAGVWASGRQLRDMFASMLMFCEVTNPKQLWDAHWESLSDDIKAMTRCECDDPIVTLSEDALKDHALYEIDQILMRNGHRLEDFSMLPKSNYIPSVHGGNRLNDDQRTAYETILNAVTNKEGKLFFVYGSGGTSKTFVWTTFLSRLQGQGKIVLAVASSGIASLLFLGGRTAHSRFKISIDLHDESTYNITQHMKVAELVRKADLIIWDEAPMMHRRAAADQTLCDLMQLDDAEATEKIFGGKTVVFGGDFRQILLVHVIILRLHINMRIMEGNSEEQREFAKWVLNVRDGSLPTIAEEEAEDYSLKGLIRTIYPNHQCHSGDAMYLMQHSILAPKNIDVDEVNNAILESLSEELHTYLSANSLTPIEESASAVAGISMDSLYPVEFLNILQFNGITNHKLELKVGVPILLLRNLNQSIGLCNGMRLIVKRLGQRVIEAEIIIGNNVGKRVFIPRIIISPSETDWPFVLCCRQFPVRVAFAIIINKSQGQTLDNVGLYVAISRVTSSANIKIFNDQGPDGYMRNVLYKEVLEM